jgi:hypothetical protein
MEDCGIHDNGRYLVWKTGKVAKLFEMTYRSTCYLFEEKKKFWVYFYLGMIL